MTFAYINFAPFLRSADELEDEYRRIGRCAFDAEHNVPFTGNRWTISDDKERRTCQWCGVEQVLANEVRIIKRWTTQRDSDGDAASLVDCGTATT